MDRFLIATISAALLSGCQTTTANKPVASNVSSQNPWHPGEVIKSFNSPTSGDIFYRQGSTPSGMTYKIYSDGEATIITRPDVIFSGWKVRCKKDVMNDKQDCDITSYDAPLLIDYGFQSTPRLVCITQHDFPGRRAQMRIGGSQPITTSENGCVSAPAVMSRLLSSETVSTRKYHWPNDYKIDETSRLLGLKDAIDLMTYVRGNRS